MNSQLRELLLRERDAAKAFKDQYSLDHKYCPKCGESNHCSTLMAFTFQFEDRDNYKDLNHCICTKCGDKHTRHDRISEGEKASLDQSTKKYRKDYSFLEYLAANETEVCGGDFNHIDPKWISYYEGFLKSVGVAMATKHKSVHDGDCIRQPQTCTLCLLWDELNDYNNYIFHHDVWLNGLI